MNAAAQTAFERGYRPHTYKEVVQPNGLVAFRRTSVAVPYVNPMNFS